MRVLVTATNADATRERGERRDDHVPSAPPVDTRRSRDQRHGAARLDADRDHRVAGTASATPTPTSGSATAAPASPTSPAPPRRATRSPSPTSSPSCASWSPRQQPGRHRQRGPGTPRTVAAAPPVNTSRPTIAGTAQRASVLTLHARRLGRRRQRLRLPVAARRGAGFVDIAGATGATYTLGVADEGAKVRLQVTATNPDGTLDRGQRPDRDGRRRAAGELGQAGDHRHRRRAARR